MTDKVTASTCCGLSTGPRAPAENKWPYGAASSYFPRTSWAFCGINRDNIAVATQGQMKHALFFFYTSVANSNFVLYECSFFFSFSGFFFLERTTISSMQSGCTEPNILCHVSHITAHQHHVQKVLFSHRSHRDIWDSIRGKVLELHTGSWAKLIKTKLWPNEQCLCNIYIYCIHFYCITYNTFSLTIIQLFCMSPQMYYLD